MMKHDPIYDCRKSQNPLYCYGYKKDTDVIQCAPESDFRNTAEFVRKIAHLPAGMTQSCPLMDTIDQNGPWMSETGSPVSRLDQIGTKEGWRRELKSIFKVGLNRVFNFQPASFSWSSLKVVWFLTDCSINLERTHLNLS